MNLGMSVRMNKRAVPKVAGRRRPKERRTFSLSPESVAFLETLSVHRKESSGQQSVSAVLDDLLIALGKEKQRQENDAKIGKYYEERTKQERQEEIDWGTLATGEFVAIELSKHRG